MPLPPVQPTLRRLFTLVAAIGWLACTGLALAQPAGVDNPPPAGDAATPPTDRTIYIPFKDLKEVLGQPAATAIVPYADYLRYLESLAGTIKLQPADAVITSATYSAKIEEDLARITAKYAVNALGKPWVELPLEFGDAAVGKIEGGEKVLLKGTGEGTYALLLGAEGEQTVTIELVARVRTSPDGREFSLAVPAVGITTLELTVPEADQTVEVTPRLLTLPVEGAAEGSTVVKANLGATKSITARWHPMASTKPEMELLASVVSRQLVTIEGGYVHHDAWLTYEILRGQLSTLQIAAPAGQRVLDVSADVGVKSWKAEEEAGRQVITVELIAPAEKPVTVEVHTERTQGDAADPVAGLGEGNTTRGIHALDAVRESGQVAVRVGEGLELRIAEQQGLTRIAAADVDPRLQPGSATAFKFYSPQFTLAVTAKQITPRVIVTQSSQLIFDDDELRLVANLGYQIERAGVFELKLKVPENLIVDDVQSEQMQDDTFDEAARTLTIKLQQSTQGNVNVAVRAHRPFEAGKDTSEQDLPILEPLDVARETGTVYVFAPPGIEVVTNDAGLQSVQPTPAFDVQPQGEARLQSAWTFTRRPVKIPVTTTRKPTRLSATIATAVDVQPETLEVATTLTYRVEFAGVDTFRFLVPEGVSGTVQIEAVSTSSGSAEIKQKTPGTAENGWVPWTVVMQRKIVGSQALRITYRRTKPTADTAAAPVGDAASVAPDAGSIGHEESILLLRPQGKPDTPDGSAAVALTQLKGEVRIAKERSLAVTSEATGGDVEPIDIRELTLLPQDGAIAYRYFRQPDDAAIEVKLTQTKHEIQEVTPTVVERGLVEIATARHAAATFRCQYLVKTTERQRLRIDLPKTMDLLGVFVDGAEEKLNPLTEGVAAQQDVDAYTVNISRRQQSDQAFVLTVQFNWNINPPPFEAAFGRGEIELPLPRIGGSESPAPVQQLQTVVYVPKGFWLVGNPEKFNVQGERNWWEGLTDSPQPHDVSNQTRFHTSITTPLDFPTDGLTATRYQNLGGASLIEVVWWDITTMTIILSAAFVLVAFILLKTSWENRLGIMLLVVFVALLFGTKDRDALAHGLAAARLGLIVLALLWLLHGVLSRRPAAASTTGPTAPPPAPPPLVPPAAATSEG
jgi:hypothetical protein